MNFYQNTGFELYNSSVYVTQFHSSSIRNNHQNADKLLVNFIKSNDSSDKNMNRAIEGLYLSDPEYCNTKLDHNYLPPLPDYLSQAYVIEYDDTAQRYKVVTPSGDNFVPQ